MTLTIHPDPQNPAGGYAFLELPGDSLPDEVEVAIQDAYSGRWLHPSASGQEAGKRWQPQRHVFSHIPVYRHDGADWVRLGPEIVNGMTEYTPLRLSVAGQSHAAFWPDTVRPHRDIAGPGALQVVAKPLRAPEPKPEVVLPPEPPARPMEPVQPLEEPDAPRARAARRPLWIFAALLALIAVAAAAWYTLSDETERLQPAGVTPVATRPDCTLPGLRALDGFGAQLEALRGCAPDVAPDVALNLIEDAAAADHPGALLVFGTLYDGDQLSPDIENLIGLSFADDPARAAEYYRRASDAGSETATSYLGATCARLEGSTLTLDKGAYDDYCR